jgi:hypothetical protein
VGRWSIYKRNRLRAGELERFDFYSKTVGAPAAQGPSECDQTSLVIEQNVSGTFVAACVLPNRPLALSS